MNLKQHEYEMYCGNNPEIVATVTVDGRPIKLRSSPEFEAFMRSVLDLDPKPMFQQAIWLEQMSHSLSAGVQDEIQSIRIRGKSIDPRATQEALAFLDALFQLDDVPRRAAAALLSTMAKRLFQIVTDCNPSLVLNDN